MDHDNGIAIDHVSLSANDAYKLSATLYSPKDENKKLARTVIVNSATGVLQGYYQHFSRYLCGKGFEVVTYDYRGIGKSADKNWRGKPLTMLDWGERDMEAVIQWCKSKFPDNALCTVSHSVGGQLIGLAPSNHHIDAALSFASQAGYYGYWSGKHKINFMFFIYIVVPVMTTLFGKLPGAVLGSEPLPKGVAEQWARWCRHPEYITDNQSIPIRTGFERFSKPMRLINFTDDNGFAPRKAVDVLASYYKNAVVDVLSKSPIDYNCASIGHFGFFKKTMPQSAWEESSDWLLVNT